MQTEKSTLALLFRIPELFKLLVVNKMSKVARKPVARLSGGQAGKPDLHLIAA